MTFRFNVTLKEQKKNVFWKFSFLTILGAFFTILKIDIFRGIFQLSSFFSSYMSKIRVVGLMKWPVANTKIKREKTIKNWKMALKMSILKILKNALEFYFVLITYHTKKYDSTTKNMGRVLSSTSAYTSEIRIWP